MSETYMVEFEPSPPSGATATIKDLPLRAFFYVGGSPVAIIECDEASYSYERGGYTVFCYVTGRKRKALVAMLSRVSSVKTDKVSVSQHPFNTDATNVKAK